LWVQQLELEAVLSIVQTEHHTFILLTEEDKAILSGTWIFHRHMDNIPQNTQLE
jgi:hypothetical protein